MDCVIHVCLKGAESAAVAKLNIYENRFIDSPSRFSLLNIPTFSTWPFSLVNLDTYTYKPSS